MSNAKNSPWSDQAVADLTRLWAGGLSCTEIGAELRLSRNAIIGKIHRLQLPLPEGKKVVARAPREYKPRAAEIKLRCIEIVPLNYTLADLPANGCHYIPGDDLLYCGHPIKEGSSYCVPHHYLCSERPRVFHDRVMRRDAA